MPSTISKEDRQFQLLLALISTRSGMTKAEILNTVRGYAESRSESSHEALERMFERDKDDIRALGAVIETIEPLGEEGETHNVMYRISAEAFSLPDSVTFTPQEMAWLDLAAQAWQAASLSDASRHALTKLKALGIDADLSLVGIAPRIRTHERSFGEVQFAVENSMMIEFDYLKPGDPKALRRKVAPLALANVHGRWFLYSFDLLREDFRIFLLSRMTSPVKVLRQEKHQLPAADYLTALKNDLTASPQSVTARVSLSPGTEAAVALPHLFEHEWESDTFVLRHFDENLLADDLVPYIDEITVEGPESLREKILERLERIRAILGEGSR